MSDRIGDKLVEHDQCEESDRARRATRGHSYSAWVDDGLGAMHVYAGSAPSPKALEALFEIRGLVVAAMARAELEAGRWEDDGGAPGPERGRATSLMPAARRLR